MSNIRDSTVGHYWLTYFLILMVSCCSFDNNRIRLMGVATRISATEYNNNNSVTIRQIGVVPILWLGPKLDV